MRVETEYAGYYLVERPDKYYDKHDVCELHGLRLEDEGVKIFWNKNGFY